MPADSDFQASKAEPLLMKNAGKMFLLFAGWVLLWRASAMMEYAPHASVWFPPAALTMAAFLVIGWRALLAIVPAAVLVTFWTVPIYGLQQSPLEILHTGALFALSHTLSFGLAAGALAWLGRRNPAPSLPALVIAFLVVASGAALAAAWLGTQALVLGGSVGQAESTGLWLPWWIGDMAAAIALTPLFTGLLGLGHRASRRWFPIIDLGVAAPKGPWTFKLVALLSLLALIMALTALSGRGDLLAFAVFFLIIPQMWITYTESAFRVALSLAAFSTLIAVSVGLLGLDEYAMVYQFAITVIAASTWFGLTVPMLVEQNRRLREMTEADELTGVTSRRHFFERSREELQSMANRGRTSSLVVFDIDHFKQINDEFGHLTGDEALRRVAATVSGQLRRDDLFGRFGGDEFMILMSDCSARQSAERAEQLRTGLHSIRLPGLFDASLAGTFSVVEIAPGESLTRAFDRADTLLLQAKRSGRDRVVTEPANGITEASSHDALSDYG